MFLKVAQNVSKSCSIWKSYPFFSKVAQALLNFIKCYQRVPTMFQQFALKFPKYDHCSKTSLQRCKVSEVCSLISVWEKKLKIFFFSKQNENHHWNLIHITVVCHFTFTHVQAGRARLLLDRYRPTISYVEYLLLSNQN